MFYFFPNNFKELEELHHGGFYLAETTNNKLTLKHVSLKLKEVTTLFINADGKTPAQVEQEILTSLPHPEDNIITLRIEGTLKEGKPSDIDFRNINKHCEKAYALLKNTTKLVTQEYEQPAIHEPSETLEQDLIKQTLTNTFHNEEEIIYTLITALDKEKLEGEKTQDYETRIINEATKALP